MLALSPGLLTTLLAGLLNSTLNVTMRQQQFVFAYFAWGLHEQNFSFCKLL